MKKILINLLLASIFSLICFNGSAQSFNKDYSTLYYDMYRDVLMFGNLPYAFSPGKSHSVFACKGYKYCKASVRHSKYGEVKGVIINARKLQRPKFKFKTAKTEDSKYSKITLNPRNTSGYRVNNDTFVVIKNFYIQHINGSFFCKKPKFAQYLGQFGKYHFYSYAIKRGLNATLLYREDGSTQMRSIPINMEDLNKELKLIFGDFIVTKSSIEATEYTVYDLPNLLHFLVYKHAFETGQPVRVNEDLQFNNTHIINGLNAKVDSIAVNTFFISYYTSDNVKVGWGPISYFVCKSNCKCFFNLTHPFCSAMVQNGAFKWFYPNGSIMLSLNYACSELTATHAFYPDGKLFWENTSIKGKRKNFQLYTTQGDPVLDAKGNGTLHFFDSINHRNYEAKYKKSRLKFAYYNDSIGDQVYIFDNEIIRLLYFSNRFLKNLEHEPLLAETLLEGMDGTLTVKMRKESDGLSNRVDIIHGVSPEVDSLKIKFLQTYLNSDYWIGYKVRGKSVKQEYIWKLAFRHLNTNYASQFGIKNPNIWVWSQK